MSFFGLLATKRHNIGQYISPNCLKYLLSDFETHRSFHKLVLSLVIYRFVEVNLDRNAYSEWGPIRGVVPRHDLPFKYVRGEPKAGRRHTSGSKKPDLGLKAVASNIFTSNTAWITVSLHSENHTHICPRVIPPPKVIHVYLS